MSKVIKIRNLEIGRGAPKICVSIMGRSEEEILTRIEESEGTACDLIELRIDYFDEVHDEGKVKALLRKIKRVDHKPMIFTLRRSEEGGKVSVDADYYRKLLYMVADSGLADLIDVECSALGDDGAAFVESLKDCGGYVIMSKHDFDKTPDEEEILSTYLSMEKMGADIAKVAYMPNSRKDVLNLICATEQMTGRVGSCPVIAISMGRLGMITRVIGEFMDSVITFASMNQASAPGQIEAGNMKTMLGLLHSSHKKVILVGFIGTGKTAVANALANTYGLKKLDLNAYIEEKEQTTISDIADNDMELFLDKETKYLRKALDKDYQVISAGTGVALRKENVDMIKQKGIVVLLKADLDTISERLKNDPGRTTINDIIDLDYMKELMKETSAVYDDIADLTIVTDDKNIERISKEIVETLGFTL